MSTNKTRVVFVRYKSHEDELPDTHVFEGHKDDALFDFVYQTLGYQVLLVDSDATHMKVGEM
jgi:hypothetical protein